MKIYGLEKLTLLDFPGRIAATVFTGGCNFRCPFCHNASLVTKMSDIPAPIDTDELFSFLERRRGILTGVCISGGEPTLQVGLSDFIKRLKAMGYAVKLDTNGYMPDVLEGLIGDGLLDYVAMDIKNCRGKYAETAGLPSLDVSRIDKSAELLMHSGIDFEFRTTVVKELHTSADMEEIGRWLCGEEKYFLQGFIDSGDLISGGLSGYDNFSLSTLLNVLKAYIPNAELRGI